jgi:hypothetical protein
VLNEDAYSNLVMSIDTTTSAGKVAFSLVRGTKLADYEDGNAEIAFARLANKYAPKTAPSLAKTNRLFCHYCQKTGHRASDCFKKKRDQGSEQAKAAKGKTTEKEEVADVVLMVIDEEEANYLKSEPCSTEVETAESINYSVYTNAKNIECLKCEDCKKYLVKGWCGKELCSTQVVGNNNEDNSESSDDLSSMPPLQVRKGRSWADQEDDSDDNNDTECEDTPDQDIALVVDNSIGRAITDNSIDEMIDYLGLVAIKKGIREPNVDSWASSVEDKLSEIEIKTPRDVVANIITINGSLQNYGQSMLHNKTLDVLARVGVNIICPQDVEQIPTALTVFEIPSDSDGDAEDYGEAGFFND